MKLQRFSGNPILSPNPANPWENLVTCNPGVILDGGVFYMLYRAAGDDEKHVIRFGLATSTDGFHFNRTPPRGHKLHQPQNRLPSQSGHER